MHHSRWLAKSLNRRILADGDGDTAQLRWKAEGWRLLIAPPDAVSPADAGLTGYALMLALDQANGSCRTMVWSRSGPVDTMLIGQPASSSSERR